MKVEYFEHDSGWYWVASGLGALATSGLFYSRRSDAVRGFERFCARVRAM